MILRDIDGDNGRTLGRIVRVRWNVRSTFQDLEAGNNLAVDGLDGLELRIDVDHVGSDVNTRVVFAIEQLSHAQWRRNERSAIGVARFGGGGWWLRYWLCFRGRLFRLSRLFGFRRRCGRCGRCGRCWYLRLLLLRRFRLWSWWCLGLLCRRFGVWKVLERLGELVESRAVVAVDAQEEEGGDEESEDGDEHPCPEERHDGLFWILYCSEFQAPSEEHRSIRNRLVKVRRRDESLTRVVRCGEILKTGDYASLLQAEIKRPKRSPKFRRRRQIPDCRGRGCSRSLRIADGIARGTEIATESRLLCVAER